MSIECQPDVNASPILFQSCVNELPIRCQSNANPMPILCQFANPMSTHCQSANPNPMTIQCKSNTIRELPILISIRIHSQFAANRMSIQRRFHVHPIYQYDADLVSIHCQSNVNQKPIGCQSSPPVRQFIVPNVMPFRCQSCANPCQSVANLMSIQCQSNAGHLPIHCRSDTNSVPIRFQGCPSRTNPLPILFQFTNSMPIYQANANPLPINSNLPIQNQPRNYLSTVCQFIANPRPI